MTAAPLNQISGMPKISRAFNGWETNITLARITQTISNGLVIETQSNITFKGTVQPLSAEEINLKPEGQRSWQWLDIHCRSGSLNLSTNDRIIYSESKYKIMAIKDYSLNGYIEYHAVKDYE